MIRGCGCRYSDDLCYVLYCRDLMSISEYSPEGHMRDAEVRAEGDIIWAVCVCVCACT